MNLEAVGLGGDYRWKLFFMMHVAGLAFAISAVLAVARSTTQSPGQPKQGTDYDKCHSQPETVDGVRFKPGLIGNGFTPDGFTVAIDVWVASDGKKVSESAVRFPSATRAAQELQTELKLATKTIEDGPKLDENCKEVGRRAVVQIPSSADGKVSVVIMWTEGPLYRAIGSESLEDALALETWERNKAHGSERAEPVEQSVFYEDPPSSQSALIERPVTVPPGALEILRHDIANSVCLKHNGFPPDQATSAWFQGSEIHLDGPANTDLVVEPNLSNGVGEQSACFLGANTMQFWILRTTQSGYQLILSVHASALEVLTHRSKGYRDIRITFSASASTYQSTIFRFDGERYQLYATKTQRSG